MHHQLHAVRMEECDKKAWPSPAALYNVIADKRSMVPHMLKGNHFVLKDKRSLNFICWQEKRLIFVVWIWLSFCKTNHKFINLILNILVIQQYKQHSKCKFCAIFNYFNYFWIYNQQVTLIMTFLLLHFGSTLIDSIH